jgi:hypothetical protein
MRGVSQLAQLLVAVLLGAALAAPAFGAEEAAASAKAPPKPSAKVCQEDPKKCEKMRVRREEFCKKNPQTCETRNEAHEARKKYCETNPDKCRKLRDERSARREKMKELCKSDKEKCAQKRAEMRKEREERRARCKDHPEECPLMGEPDKAEEPHKPN